MQTETHTMQHERQPLVIVDPLVARFKRLRKLMIVSMIVAAAGWALILVAFFIASRVRIQSPLSDLLPLYAFILVCSLASWPLNIFNTLRQERFWKRLEAKRQAAASGEQGLLAAQQPVPNANALQLPITIQQRPNWLTLLLVPGLIVILMAIAVPLMYIFLPQMVVLPHHRQLPQLWIAITIGLTALLVLIVCAILFGVLYGRVRQQLTITEHGLIKPGFRKAHSVSWREARLFAIDGLLGTKNYQYPIMYELSSANDIVRWGWMRRSTRRVLFFAKPTMPTEDYDQQMEAVLSLIAGRTSLPLYDLRDKKQIAPTQVQGQQSVA